jgi:flagellar motor component MotA
MRIVGAMAAFGLMLGSCYLAGGLEMFLHPQSAIFVIVGAIACGFMGGDFGRFVEQAGNGAVYFGWLGSFIGLIATINGYGSVMADQPEMGHQFLGALAICMVTVLYGYVLKILSLAFVFVRKDADTDAA